MNTSATHFEKQFLAAKPQVFPVLGFRLNASNTISLDLGPSNTELATINLKDTRAFDSYIFGKLMNGSKKVGFGGYFENRAVYARSEHFGGEEPRNIHLGIDLWYAAGSPIYAPFDATKHSFADNEGFGNYGPTLILRHHLGELTFYTLYGHLSRSDMAAWEKDAVVKAGEKIAHIGPFPENGDWPPHLHFQIMTDTLGWIGDFPGVCSPSQVDFYKTIVPDASLILLA